MSSSTFQEYLPRMNCVGMKSSVRPTLLFQRPACRVNPVARKSIDHHAAIYKRSLIQHRHVMTHAAASFPGSSDEDSQIDLLLESKGAYLSF